MTTTSDQRDPVEVLAEEFAERQRRGERPTLTEYTSRYPDQADAIRDLFPALQLMEQFGSVAGPSPRAEAPAADVPKRLGDYCILRMIGQGGMGIVYEAVQESLGRHVALKVMAGRLRDPGQSRERFRREARAAARLHHTNIVPVFGVGEDGDSLYYAMQYIAGQALDNVLIEVRQLRSPPTAVANAETLPPGTPPARAIAHSLVTGSFAVEAARGALPAGGPALPTPPMPMVAPPSATRCDLACAPQARYYREVARLGAQAGDGLAYAHAQGVLHRDIKPSNLLLDAAGTLWITDFGLAKADDSADLTGTGDLLGTVRYMAPERFDGRADARSDVYALGVTLYEMLTLRPPFDDRDALKLIDQIATAQPPRPRTIDPLIPRDLETIVLRAMAKESADRYPSAAAMADDLTRFLGDRPIAARRHSLRERAWRWCRRNPAVASLSAALAVLLVVLTVGTLVKNADLRRALAKSDANWRESREQLWTALKSEAYGTRLSRREGQRFKALDAAWRAAQLGREMGHPPEKFAELRTEAIGALAQPDIYPSRTWETPVPDWAGIRAAAGLTLYARAEADGETSVRRVADGGEVSRLPNPRKPSTTFLSPDGRYAVQWVKGGPTLFWRLGSPPTLTGRDESPTPINDWAFHPARNWFLVGTNDGRLLAFDAAAGRRLYDWPSAGVADGQLIVPHPTEPLAAVSSYFAPVVQVRDLTTGAVVASRPAAGGTERCAWHPDGRELAVPSSGNDSIELVVFDLSRRTFGADRRLHGRIGGGARLAYHPAGDRLIVASWWTGTTHVFDTGTGRQVFETKFGAQLAPQLDAGGRNLGTAYRDRRATLFSLADGREYRPLFHDGAGEVPMNVNPVAVSPDGRLAALSVTGSLCVFDLDSGRVLAHVPLTAGNSSSPAFESSGSLLTNGHEGCFRWPVRNVPGDPARVVVGPPERLPFQHGNRGIAASRGGRVVAQAMYNGYGMAQFAGGWILHPDRPLWPRHVLAGLSVVNVTVSPDGRLAAFVEHGGESNRVFDTATGREIWNTGRGGPMRFTPDGRWLVVGPRLYAVGTWRPGVELGEGLLFDISADSRLALLGTPTGFYRLVELATGNELARLEDPGRAATPAVFTPDGTRLVAAAKQGVNVWDLRRIREELSALGLDWDAPPFQPAAPAAPPRSEPAVSVTVVGTELLDPAVSARWDALRLTWRLWHAPDDADVYAARAAAFERLRWFAAARADYGEALRRRPDDAAVRLRRGLLAMRARDPAAALADFDHLLRLSPKSTRARYQRAQALTQLGRDHEAVAEFDRLIAALPADGELYLFRGDCHSRLGDAARAEADVRKAVALGVDQPSAANNLAWRLAAGPEHLRDPAKALTLARKAVEGVPGKWVYHNTLGVALYRCGEYAEAMKVLSASLEHTAADGAAWDLYFLAMCHHRLGDAAKARDCFDRAVRWQAGKQLSARDVNELDGFRAEAAALLGRSAAP